MNEYLFFLRLVHIVAGVIWAGAAIMLGFFVLPAINTSGPEGGKVMQQIVATNKYPLVMNVVSGLTVISGILLIWHFSGGFKIPWIISVHGGVLVLGGLAAIVAYFLGYFFNRPCGLRMAQIRKEIAGGKPTEKQIAEINAIRKKVSASSLYIGALLLLSVATMAVARYLF